MIKVIKDTLDKLDKYDRYVIDHKADDYYYLYLSSDSLEIEIDLIYTNSNTWNGVVYVTDYYDKDILSIVEFTNIKDIEAILKGIEI